MPKLLHHLKALYRQHRYQQLIMETETDTSAADDEYAEVQLLRIKALQALGLSERAFQAVSELRTQELSQESWRIQTELWYRFLWIYHTQPSDLQGTLAYYTHLIQTPTLTPYVAGLANDLLGRVISLGMAVQLLSPVTHKKQGEGYWLAAAGLYQTASVQEDYLGVLKRLADLQQRPPRANRHLSRATYTQLMAAADDFPLVQLEARLAIAEIDFTALKSQLHANAEVELGRILSEFSAIEQQLEAESDAWGYAHLPDRVGTLLLRYGHPEGEALLKESVDRYAKGPFVVDQQGVLRTLAHWYQLRGEESRFRQTEIEANALNRGSEFELGHQVDQLNRVNIAFRAGNYGEALQRCQAALDDEQQSWTRSQFLFLRANTLSVLGRQEKMEAAEAAVAFLRPTGITSSLADALVLWAQFLFGALTVDAYRQALPLMQEAIEIESQLENTLAQANRYALLSQFLVDWYRAYEGQGVINQLVEACWEQAFRLLGEEATYEGFIQLGALLQTKGQLLFIAGHREAAQQQLAEAERVFLEAEAKGHLVFLYSQQGLAGIQQARLEQSQNGYWAALRKLDQAYALVTAMNLGDTTWRIAFQRGICFRELGQLTTSKTEQRQWHTQAEEAYQTAHELLYQLMLTVDFQAGASQHASMAGFVGERQTVYQQGFYLNLLERKDLEGALRWLDRMKSQALLASVRKQAGLASAQRLVAHSPDVNWAELHKNLVAWQVRLAQRVVVFVYYVTEGHQLVFSLSAGTAAPQVDRVLIPYDELRQLKRQVFEQPGGFRRLIEDETEGDWYRFKSLIEPVEKRSAAGDMVLLIPHGIVHNLPLHTLPTRSGRPLLERNPTGYHLSIGLLQEAMNRPDKPQWIEKHVFGDSLLNLPGAAREARRIADQLKAQVHLGPAVTRARFLEVFIGADFIHFAGHGEFTQQEGLDQRLLLATSESVTAGDLIGLSSPAQLMVFSGCETGLNEYRAGDEPFGLLRGLLAAGVACVVTSQWRINDSAAELFFSYFYEHAFTGQPGEKLRALQGAANRMIQDGRSAYEWGSFVLTGSV